MSEIKNAEISINLSESSFSIVGSEEFIEKNKTELIEFIKNNKFIKNTVTPPQIQTNNQAKNESITDSLEQNNFRDNEDINKYKDRVISIDETSSEIHIIKKVPGKTKAKQTRNVALILAYFKQSGEISSKEIQKHCEDQNCFDSAHFAYTFKNEPNFTKKGTGHNWILKINLNGKDKVKSILEEMLNAQK